LLHFESKYKTQLIIYLGSKNEKVFQCLPNGRIKILALSILLKQCFITNRP